ncbi:hypothetical protein SAMD00019534_122030 [Acytostelium subglobosum LB1]|uniref:hypothetical protein n=1 Tax=Acytostelium subglobosum LB1 TaxID=1410327 RepID=UPI000644DCF6|nr:hypothetical protein SAMD00019534_122030 [Acytostelium subglobosum LB1]GAM29027.1 hypothetical protein SAMD00019534_122030 [Acytostelium subglobosum LB1]|eukprot:XP_012748033.1 hypothetical protein SAMD00019534_122030 [Acytostelium subglobosum LB1]
MYRSEDLTDFQPTLEGGLLYGTDFSEYPYPFGIISNKPNSGLFKYKYTYAFPVDLANSTDMNALNMYILYCANSPDYGTFWQYLGPYPIASTSISLPTINLKMLSSDSFIVRLRIRTSGHAFQFAKLYGDEITATHLIQGTNTDGWYEREFSVVDYILNPVAAPYFQSFSGRNATIQYDFVVNINFDMFPSVPTMMVVPADFSSFQFQPSYIDVTNGPRDVVLTFGLKSSYPTSMIQPYLYIDQFEESILPLNRSHLLPATYDVVSQTYSISFTVREKLFTRALAYRLFIGGACLRPKYLSTSKLIQNNAFLQVYSEYADEMGPIVSSLIPKMGTVVVSSSLPVNWVELGWSVTIDDYPAGFSHGLAVIRSDIDNEPRNISFTLLDAISGDKYQSTYRLMFNISTTCTSQSFYPSLELYDTLGNMATNLRSTKDNSPYITPFYKLDSPFRIDRSIVVNCTGSNDTVAPSIMTLDLQPYTVDVGSNDRKFQVNITVADSGSGISTRHCPYLYVQTLRTKYIRFQSQYSGRVGSYYVFTVNGELPFGFGVNSAFLSVFGVVDNMNNVAGLTTWDLQSYEMTYMINTTLGLVDPYLFSSTPITTNGGKMIVKGRIPAGPYTLSVSVINQTVILPVLNITNSVVTFQMPPMSSVYPIVIVLTVSGRASNKLTVIPTQYFTPSPPVPPCSDDQCSGHGTCLANECQCFQGWAGATCLDQPTANVTPPVITPTNASSTVIIPQDDSTITLHMGVVSVREVAVDGSIVKEHPLANWTRLVTDNSNSSYHQFIANISGDGVLVTTVKATVQFFTNLTQIPFAGSVLTMQPNTIKYTIELSEYSFQNILNTMQVLMSASVASSQDCSASPESQVGLNADGSLQWVRLVVGGMTLYGRMFQKAVIDLRPTYVTSTLAGNVTLNDSITALVALNLPHYTNTIVCDPDFQVLVDGGASSTSGEDKCGLGAKNNISGLSNAALSGIIVGGVVFLAVVIGASILLYKNIRYHREEKILMNRLNTNM